MILRSISLRSAFTLILFFLLHNWSMPIICMEFEQDTVSLELTKKINNWIERNFENDPVQKNYVCNDCSTIHDSQRECFVHYVSAHGAMCIACGKTFKKNARLQEHLINDNNSEDHQNFKSLFFVHSCSKCDSKFLLEKGKRIHENSHCLIDNKNAKRSIEKEKMRITKKMKLATNEKLDAD